jgi:exopolyphosphatase/guanosine-5'-triphosphate,3'-diphosphate pyrophosphatase
LGFLFLAFGSAVHADPCVVRRAAFDVGSGSTKMTVADVNACEQRILSVVLESAEKVDYKESLSRSSDRRFSDEVVNSGLAAMKRLKSEALSVGVQAGNFSGIATAAFREAENGRELLDRFTSELGVALSVISQEEEGKIGFYSAMAVSGLRPEELVVWDIGGGSMQITYYEGRGLKVFRSSLASVSFKNRVVREIQQSSSTTANPLSGSELESAVQMARSEFKASLPAALLSRIREAGGVIHGIGGVHGASLRNRLGVEEYTGEDLRRGIARWSGKTDAEVGGAFASTEVTNLALVLGAFEALGASRVRTWRVSGTMGVLIHPQFWNQ